VVLLDGVFTRDEDGRLLFHAPPPTLEELGEVLRRTRRRVVAWLARRGYAEGHPRRSDERAERTSLDSCAAIVMQRGSLHAV
jgi:hypothetical protein